MCRLLIHWIGKLHKGKVMMPEVQNTLTQFQTGLLYMALLEVMQLLYVCRSTTFEVDESWRRKWARLLVILS